MTEKEKTTAPLTDEQKVKDIEGRVKEANDKIAPILKELKLSWGSEMKPLPNGLFCVPILIDVKFVENKEEEK